MRKLLQVMCSIDKFIDYMIIFIRTFQDHLLVVEEFLQRFRTANLTAKPSKFHWIQQPRMFGIHCGKPKAETHTRESGSNRELFQTTNKEAFKIVSWFNGLLSEIHPQFFSFSVSIVGSDQERTTDKVMRRESQHNAFLTLKSALMVTPVLKLPYIFILKIDVSDEVIGAILLQH